MSDPNLTEIYIKGDDERIRKILDIAKRYMGIGISVIDLNPQLVKEEEEDEDGTDDGSTY